MIKSEVYSDLCQTSNVDSLASIANGFKKITIFNRNFILDRQDSEYASANIFQLYPKSTFCC